MREALGGVGLGIGPWHDVQRFDAVLQRPDRGAQMRGAVLGQAAFGEIRPAATMIQAGLADPRMRIEIEVDAIIGSA